MTAYEFYWHDETKREHLIGILPERRKNRERITEESILAWGWKIVGRDSDINDIFFVRIEM